MILLIDNYDSFVFNLARYFQRLGQPTHVVRNDALDAAGVAVLRPSAIVLSPGPCTPREAGCSIDVVKQLHAHVPMLGVCLGHQTIGAALGGEVIRAPAPRHGRTSAVFHDGDGLFAGIASPTEMCRYHSLVVRESALPDALAVTARTEDGVVMALQHRLFPVYGVQFHPESILTEAGYPLLRNFLKLTGLKVPEAELSQADEFCLRATTHTVAPPLPGGPPWHERLAPVAPSQ